MAQEVTLEELISIISKLQVNYTFLAKSWYDIFYNSTPIEKVDINYYDDSGKLQTDTIPNLAYARQYYIQGEGAPEGNVAASKGTIYQDTTNGDAYIKHSGDDSTYTGWIKFISTSEINNIIMKGSGSPERRISAAPGTLYIDQDDNKGTLYMKRSTTGNTGWERIDSYPTSFTREVFTVPQGTATVQLAMRNVVNSEIEDNEEAGSKTCESEELLSIYVDGTLISPKKYRLWNDHRTIEFGYYDLNGEWVQEPIYAADTENSIEVIVQYFTDIHFYDGGVTQDYINLLHECTEAAETVKTMSVKVEAAAESLQIKIDGAVETAVELAQRAVAEVSADCIETITDATDKIQNDLTNMSNVIKSEYRDISSWYTRIGQIQVSVAEMQKDVATMKQDIYTNSYYIHAKSLIDDIMLKSVYEPELQRIEEKSEADDASLREDFTNSIARVDNDIVTNVNELTLAIETLDSARSSAENEIRNTVATYNETNISEHDEMRGQLSDIAVNYFNDSNFPVGIKSVYQYNKNLNTDEKSKVTENDGVIIYLRRDCFYYTADLGKVMDAAGRDITFDGFEIKPGSTLDSDLTGRLDNYDPENPDQTFYSDDFSNVMLQARIMFKNEANYKPIVAWDDNKITWLGGEEPDFEAGKNYLIEFISYDLAGTWYAHVLGICQPSIRVDDFNVWFNVTFQNYNASGRSGEFYLYYDTETEPNMCENALDSDGVPIPFSMAELANLEKTLKRKYKGSTITNVGVYEVGSTPAFSKHMANAATYTLSEDAVFNVVINMNNQPVKTTYTFDLTLISMQVEDYLRKDEEQKIKGNYPLSYNGTLQLDNVVKGTRYKNLISVENGYKHYGDITNVEQIWVEQEGEHGDKEYVWNGCVIHYQIEDRAPASMQYTEFLNSDDFWLLLDSPYHVGPLETDRYECAVGSGEKEIQVKLGFLDNDVIYDGSEHVFQNAKYVLDPVNSNNSGIRLQLNTDDDLLTLGVSPEKESTKQVDNAIAWIKLRYPENSAGQCLIHNDKVQLYLNDEANVSLSDVGQWE